MNIARSSFRNGLVSRTLITKPTYGNIQHVRPTTRRQMSQFTKGQAAVGVFTPKAAALFIATGVGLFFYFRHEKQKMLEAREEARKSKQTGRAHVGGPFALNTHTGESFTEKDMVGKWSLVYFGFTNCPDICPAELDKIGSVLTDLETALPKTTAPILPLFISVDPARDSLPQMHRYLQDFHSSIVGLVGSYAATKAICRAYRVYFSTPPDAKPTDDYLVDHSIFVYFMDPDGLFVEAFGQAITKEEIVERVVKEVSEWDARKK